MDEDGTFTMVCMGEGSCTLVLGDESEVHVPFGPSGGNIHVNGTTATVSQA